MKKKRVLGDKPINNVMPDIKSPKTFSSEILTTTTLSMSILKETKVFESVVLIKI